MLSASMSKPVQTDATNNPAIGIGFILLAMVSISVNDMLIKQLSGGYPLHQMVFIRSLIGVTFSLFLVKYEGGLSILRTQTPMLHALRGIMIVISNLMFFTALAVVPLAEVTALFFVAPLMITLLAIPVLGEKVSILRLGAIVVGFIGVIIMIHPWESADERKVSMLILFLPVIAAFTYALNQVLTRKLGVASKASAMAVYIQGMFIIVSLGFFIVAGDGRFAEVSENESIRFLLRAWVWPQGTDRYLFVGLGFNSAIIGYSLSQAYRMADASIVAPFEYAGLPLAVMWGWVIWGEFPGPLVWIGIALIVGAGLFVFLRERQKKRRVIGAKKRIHRR